MAKRKAVAGRESTSRKAAPTKVARHSKKKRVATAPLNDSHPHDDAAPSDRVMRVLRAIAEIPQGKVASYGEVALRAGMPRGARFVGYVLRTSPLAASVPWHRVVNASGRIALRGDKAVALQRQRLIKEGWQVSPGGRLLSQATIMTE